MTLDTDFSFGTFSLPSLDGTIQPPARNPNRRISRHGSGGFNLLPPHLVEKDGEEVAKNEGKISMMDPRRFTPTLHANLVSEILSLRREVESKSKLVLNLEESLLSSREENSKLGLTIAENGNETKELKRQMQMLEGGTLSAIEELAAERDQAAQHLNEVKKHLEASQKKAKSREEEVDRTNALWEQDRENWDSERRNLDLKVHIAEARLMTILSEIEAAQVYGRPRSSLDLGDRPQSRPQSRTGGVRSAASHHRRGSSVSTDGAGARRYRLSHISEISRMEGGATLADELQFDDDFSDDNNENAVPLSPEALPEEYAKLPRPFSSLSHRQSVKACKLLGIAFDDEGANEGLSDTISGAVSANGNLVQHGRAASALQYTDTATQFSPPPSPKLLPTPLVDALDGSGLKRHSNGSVTDHASGAAAVAASEKSASAACGDGIQPIPMVSSACQTIEHPLSPPATPTNSKASALASSSSPKIVEMSTVSTQTLPEEMPSATLSSAAFRDKTRIASDIPIIAIRPPTSSGTSRNSVALPPGTKNASCQASITVSHRSASVQTEGIRIDQRSFKLPPHLLPSAISSKPSSPVPESEKASATKVHVEPAQWTKLRPPSIVLPRSSKRLSKDANEDPFVGFEGGDEAELQTLPLNDGNVSDDSFLNKEPIRKTLSKVHNHWKTVSQSGDEAEPPVEVNNGGPATTFRTRTKVHNRPDEGTSARQGSTLKANKAGKILEPISTGRQVDVRRTALISSGTAAHMQRSRSPSLPVLPVLPITEGQQRDPPFPVPTRSSSRKFPWESSEGTASPTPGTVTFFSSEQPQKKQPRPPMKKPVLRKIRSATNESYQPQRSRSRSPPPPTSASSYAQSPRFPHPPLPNDDIASPYRMSFKTRQPSGPAQSVATSGEDSAGSEQTSVVDAIAQTMIGEWMWKYVRRRKSFGLPDNADFDKNNEATNGIRHQRWVWLAPYERAVMWSSKQPMSGPALMGKNGRKLTIQSVLDVRDDAPMPKGAGSASCFGRSILILTPQRALKFTAITRERHYIWLTALSFLSHSSVVPPNLGRSVPDGSPETQNFSALNPSDFGRPTSQSQPTTAVLRRHPIRDSIRVAKGKSRPTPNGARLANIPPTNLTQHGPAQNEPLVEDEEANAAAEAPHVPRTTSHTRKRSNTGPRSSFRSFSSSNKPSLSSFHNYYSSSSTAVRPRTTSVHSGSGGRGGGDVASEASYTWTTDAAYSNLSRTQLSPAEQHEEMMMLPEWTAEPLSGAGGAGANFFDAVGTVRMEAFVKDRWVGGKKERNGSDRMSHGSVNSSLTNGTSIAGPGAGERIRGSFKTRPNRKKDFGHWGAGSEVKVGGAPDPFEGF